MSNVTQHIPVLLNEVIANLNLKSGDNAIDATLGGGGHAEAILEATKPAGKLLGIDWDNQAVSGAAKRLAKHTNRIILKVGTYTDIKQIAYESGINPIHAILLDLGLSTDQLHDSARGFSFSSEGSLDMRFSGQGRLTAGAIVNTWPENELAHIFRVYGEERHATRIARHIVATRQLAPISSVPELVALVMRGAGKRGGRIHPATRVFQALRIATNFELDNIAKVLPEALSLLAPGGRLAVISFHSLEDRIVKHWFRDKAIECVCPPLLPLCRCGHKAEVKLITKKAITPGEAEVKANPASRSAKLRVIEKI
ncbi:MAG: 16S rRNA (cytosine(1402)-N(4))-methyltransferase RsmH [Patescibacteria group bacterium]